MHVPMKTNKRLTLNGALNGSVSLLSHESSTLLHRASPTCHKQQSISVYVLVAGKPIRIFFKIFE